jgi:carbon storage regulator CsrA
MLVLTRRAFENLVFPDLGITIRVLAINRQTVKIGIEAPTEIAVYREELLKRSERLEDITDPLLVSN